MLIQDFRAAKILYNFLKSNDIQGRFLIPANVCSVLPLTFYAAGVDFDFVDIQEDNLCINQQLVLEKLNDYSGVLFVRTYGIERSFESFFSLIKKDKPDFCIIDDCCLCLPKLKLNPDRIADLELYSVGYAKQIDLGVGAFGFINESLTYKEQVTEYIETGFESFENELKQSIRSNTKFCCKDYKYLDNKKHEIDFDSLELKKVEIIQHKEKLNHIYKTNLPERIQYSEEFQHWRFNIQVEKKLKDELLNDLFRNGLFASSHYYPLSYIWSDQTAPVAMNVADNVINLFNDKYYNEEKAFRTCEIIKQFVQ